jgi:hypothetical protein
LFYIIISQLDFPLFYFLGTPVPDFDPPNPLGDRSSLSMVSAMKKVTEGRRLFEKYPSWLTNELLLLGVIEKEKEENNDIENNNQNDNTITNNTVKKESKKNNLNEISGFKGFKFHKKVLKSLQKSFFLYNFLLEQVELANNLNTSILKYLELMKNSKDTVSDDKQDVTPTVTSLHNLYNQMTNLRVQPPLSTKKQLDKMMNVGVGDSSQDVDDDEYDENPSKTVGKEKDGKSSGVNVMKKSGAVYGNGKQSNNSGVSSKYERDRDRERGGDGSEVQRRKRPLTDTLQNLPDNKDRTQNILGTDSTYANVQVQGQGTAPTKNRERNTKKGKSSLPPCAAKECTEDVFNIDSNYCSDLCATVAAEELLSAMLEIREKLCLQKWWKSDTDYMDKTILKNITKDNNKKIELIEGQNELNQKVVTLQSDLENEKKNNSEFPPTKKSKNESLTVFDINAFETRILNKNEALRELTDAIQRQKFVFSADENYLKEIKLKNEITSKIKIEKNVDVNGVKKNGGNIEIIDNENTYPVKNENVNVVNSDVTVTTTPSEDMVDSNNDFDKIDKVDTDIKSTSMEVENSDNIVIVKSDEASIVISDGVKQESETKSGEKKNGGEEMVIVKEDDVVVLVKAEVQTDMKTEVKEEMKEVGKEIKEGKVVVTEEMKSDIGNEIEEDVTGHGVLNSLLASANQSLLESDTESEKQKENKRKDTSALQSMISVLPSAASLLLLREADGGPGPGQDPSPRSSHVSQVL